MSDETDPRVEFKVHFETSRRGRKRAVVGERPEAPAPRAGRVPRVTKLMALAIRFEQLIRDGEVTDLAEIARIGHVTRARVTQIMNMALLAPDIQEAILTLRSLPHGREAVSERDLRDVAASADWRKQRRMWQDLVRQAKGQGGDPT